MFKLDKVLVALTTLSHSALVASATCSSRYLSLLAIYNTEVRPVCSLPIARLHILLYTMFHAVPHQYPIQLSPSPPIDRRSTIPPPAMVTSAPIGPESKPRKLRASCDACSRAKVKCDKV
jgi:hypothetical protein